METKIAQGVWKVAKNDPIFVESDAKKTSEDYGTIAKCFDGGIRGTREQRKQAKSHALLIADAGNTFNETGRLPSELAKQNKELLDALKELSECDYTSGTHLYTAQLRAKQLLLKLKNGK